MATSTDLERYDDTRGNNEFCQNVEDSDGIYTVESIYEPQALPESKLGDVDIKKSKNIHFGSQFINSTVTLVDNSGNLKTENFNPQNSLCEFRYKTVLILIVLGIIVFVVFMYFFFSDSTNSNQENRKSNQTTTPGYYTEEPTATTAISRYWFQDRSSWGALPASACSITIRNVEYIYIYKLFDFMECMDALSCTKSLQTLQGLKLPYQGDLNEHFVLGGDGCVYEGRSISCLSEPSVKQCAINEFKKTLFIGMTLKGHNECITNDPTYKKEMQALKLLFNYLSENRSITFDTYNIVYPNFCKADQLVQTFVETHNFSYCYPEYCILFGLSDW